MDIQQVRPRQLQKSPLQWIDFIVLVFFLVLIRLPAAYNLQDNIVVRFLFLAPIIFVIWRRIVVFFTTKNLITFVANKYFPIYIFYILLMILAFSRTMLNSSVDTSKTVGNFTLFILSFGFIFVLSSQTEKPGDVLKRGIYLSLLVYVVLNLLMEVLNLSSRPDIFANPQISTIAASLGFSIYRTTFPMATGINSYGIIAGILLIGSFFVLREKRFGLFLRASGLLGIFASLVTLMSTDSRAATFFAILTIACSFIPFPVSRILRILPVLSVALPSLLLWTLRSIPWELLQLVSRNRGDAITLTNRTVIWEAGLQTLIQSPGNWLFGYGYRGQIASGAMVTYKHLFVGFTDATSITMHNSFLQAIYEIGLIGFLLLILNLLILFFILDRNRRLSISPWTNMLYFSLIYLTFISSTDSVLTFDNQEAYILFIFIATVTFFSGSIKKQGAPASL